MVTLTLNVEAALIGSRLKKNQSIKISNGYIESISDSHSYSDNHSAVKPLCGTLVPGFIDIQVNGGGGFLFNHSPDCETLLQIAKAHQCFGTTGWMPTLITDSVEKMEQAANAVSEAIQNQSSGIIGIHFEGPHISTEKKGIHKASFIRQLSEQEKYIYSRNDIGKVMITIAPEAVSPSLIKQLVDMGVVVCLGHSNATFEQTQKAIEAGASGFTHLFNAMSQFNSREPGMVGAALASSSSSYGLIMDKIHVHPCAALAAYKANPNMMLVTDAMPIVGCEDKEFDYFGETIFLKDNKLIDSEGRLAGSAINMHQAFLNAMDVLSISIEKATELATTNAARFLSLDDQEEIAVGQKANFILLDQHNNISEVWCEGKTILQ